MNILDAKVTKIIGKPHYEYNRWWIEVECIDIGGRSRDNLMFDTKEEAEAVQPGHRFQHLRSHTLW